MCGSWVLRLSWELINIRNVDNVTLEIDLSEESTRHNGYVFDLLINEQAYYEYITPIIHKLVGSYLSKMNAMVQPKICKASTRGFKKMFILEK